MKYIKETKDGIELEDSLVLKAIYDAAFVYEDGAIVEACSILEDVIGNLREYINNAEQ